MDYKDFKIDVKEVGEDGTFTGIASVYGEEDLGGDVIQKGAFTRTIAENPEVPVLWQHKPDEVIGKGALREFGRKIILDGKLDLEDPTAMKAYKKMKAGLIKGLSIGFSVISQAWKEVEDRAVRYITELRLWEVSIVTFPMLPAAQVTRVKTRNEEFQATEATNGTPANSSTPGPPQAGGTPPNVETDRIHSLFDAVHIPTKGLL